MYNYDDAYLSTVALVSRFILPVHSVQLTCLCIVSPSPRTIMTPPCMPPSPAETSLSAFKHHPMLLLSPRSPGLPIQDDLQHLSRPFAVSQSSDPCLTCPFDPIVINPVLSPRTPRCPNGPPSPFFPQTPDCYLTHLCTPALRYSLVVPVPTISVAFSLVTQ